MHLRNAERECSGICILAEIALKFGFTYIGIESTNDKSSSFARKLGFQSVDGSNYVIAVNSLIDYFQDKD